MTKEKKIEELAKTMLNCHCGLLEEEAKMIAVWCYKEIEHDVAEDIIRMLRAAGINEFRYPVVAKIKEKYMEGKG
jgi:hypothetical protein